jgi:hypothetical protein
MPVALANDAVRASAGARGAGVAVRRGGGRVERPDPQREQAQDEDDE